MLNLIPELKRGNKLEVELLFEYNSEIDITNNDGLIPFLFAVNWDHKEVVKLLFEYNTNLNHRDKDGWTPLFLQSVVQMV
ncbi:hypothetical protein N7452_010668 [Penicillium brevicompactum]|uniref:Ankyrin repeat protein n=1 Tax=Penicillium brevicompactum TaxID=5074 RepID=A0A9W9Q135_PENBR|nr:hypothetical protein N7452_010668 [Penicillium brevicompactum]